MKNLFTKKNILNLLPIVIFMIIVAIAFYYGFDNFDSTILNFFKSIRNENLTSIVSVITQLSSFYFLLFASLCLFISLKNKKVIILQAVGTVIGVIINQLIKFFVARPRPADMLIEESGYSFPSAHAMISIIFYGFLIYYIYTSLDKKVLKNVVAIFLTLLILIIATTRIYLGVHYPSDVLFGLIFGYVYLIIYIKITKKHYITK